MSKTSGSMNQTVVKILVGIFVGFIPAAGWAQAPANYSEIKKDCLERAAAFKDDKAEYAFQYNSCMATSQGGRAPERTEDKNKVNCNEVEKQVSEIRRNITKACNDAGLGKSCAKNSEKCAEEIEEESFDTRSAIGSVLGIPMANDQQVKDACPQMGTRDIAEGRKSLQKDIKEDEQKLADLTKDAADLQADYDKEVQKIQEELTKAQEDFKKKEKEFSQEERQRIADFQKTQAQAAQDMRTKGDEILALRGQLTALLRNKARALNKLSDSAGKLTCMAEVNKLKSEYEKLVGSNTSNSGNFIGQAKRKKLEMERTFATCMADFYQQRIQLNEQTRNDQEKLEKRIEDTQAAFDNIQDSLNLAQSQLSEIAKDASDSKKEALQSVIDLGTRLQQQMQSAYTKLQQNLQALKTKTASAQKSLQTSNNELLSLGPVPKTKKDLSASDAAETISEEIKSLQAIAENPGNQSCPGIKNIKKTTGEYQRSHGAK